MKNYFLDYQYLEDFCDFFLKKSLLVKKIAVSLPSQTKGEQSKFGRFFENLRPAKKSETVAERRGRFESKEAINHSGALKQEKKKYNNTTMKSLILAQDER